MKNTAVDVEGDVVACTVQMFGVAAAVVDNAVAAGIAGDIAADVNAAEIVAVSAAVEIAAVAAEIVAASVVVEFFAADTADGIAGIAGVVAAAAAAAAAAAGVHIAVAVRTYSVVGVVGIDVARVVDAASIEAVADTAGGTAEYSSVPLLAGQLVAGAAGHDRRSNLGAPCSGTSPSVMIPLDRLGTLRNPFSTQWVFLKIKNSKKKALPGLCTLLNGVARFVPNFSK